MNVGLRENNSRTDLPRAPAIFTKLLTDGFLNPRSILAT